MVVVLEELVTNFFHEIYDTSDVIGIEIKLWNKDFNVTCVMELSTLIIISFPYWRTKYLSKKSSAR